MSTGTNIQDLASITNADLATDDILVVDDTSATTTKTITVEEVDKRYVKVSGGYAAVSTTYTATVDDRIVAGNTSSGAFTITLPTAASLTGQVMRVMKVNSDFNKLTIDGNGSETIGGQTSVFLLGHEECVELVSDGTNWRVLSWEEGREIQGACVFGQENNIDKNQYSITFSDRRMNIYEAHTEWTGSAGTATTLLWVLPGSLSIDTTRRVGGTDTLNHESTVYGTANVFTTAWVNYSIQYSTSTSVRFNASSVTLQYANVVASDSIRFNPGVCIPIA